MSKYILASAAALTLVLAPVASMAQGAGDSGSTAPSQQMKGPPNADGMKTKDGSGEMKSGRSDASTNGSNGAAAAKATGADKK